MPLYEYSCPSCGSTFDALRKFDEREQPVACVQCGADAQRLFSRPAILGGGLSRSVPEWRPTPNGPPITAKTKI
jgi:putative FmdB family regulatory protein